VRLPLLIQKGGTLSATIIPAVKLFPAGKKIILEPSDAYQLIFTLRHIIGPSIFQSHIGAGKPSQGHPISPNVADASAIVMGPE
jgi:hypothetical protein